MQHQTTKLALKYKLATTILTQKAQRAGVAYNVSAHVAQLAQQGALPCHTATGQAVSLNILHNISFNFAKLCVVYNALYNAYVNLNLTPAFMVKVTPQPNLNYLMQV
jgi:hypothetical protein